MKKKLLLSLSLPLLGLVSSNLFADSPTPDFEQSKVEARLNLEVKADTKEVHFISTNNDPDVITKVYVLKHVKPYEIMPYLKSAVKHNRVSTSDTGIESIVYNDGTNLLIVSAEDYRFGKQESGMGIDEVIATLDLPKMTSSSGSSYYMYFPKYWDAETLRKVMNDNGLENSSSNTINELAQGKDRVVVDPSLNALLLYLPPYSIKRTLKMLNIYDKPIAEAQFKYSIYELESENAAQLGTDFQAWKNGPGADLFAIGSRYTHGWNVSDAIPATRGYLDGSTHTKYIRFNPRWSTKFLDFLAAESRSKVVTSGTIDIMNNTTGVVNSTTHLPYIKEGASLANGDYIGQSMSVVNKNFTVYTFAAKDKNGNAVTLAGTLTNVNLTATKTQISQDGNKEYYYYVKVSGNDVHMVNSAGQNLGTKEKLYDLVVTDGTTAIAWSDKFSMDIEKDKERDTAMGEYGFKLTITPTVCIDATKLDLTMSNTNLIGYKSDGVPRTSYSTITTNIMVQNNVDEQLVVGGLSKETLIKNAGKVPYLGDMPGLGWIFGGESGKIVKTELITVLDCNTTTPDTALSSDVKALIDASNKKIKDAGSKDKDGNVTDIDYGFDQFLFDAEKDEKGFDPLP